VIPAVVKESFGSGTARANEKNSARNVMGKANPKLNMKKHKILWVDRNRLVLCGLLDKYPTMSSVTRRILTPSTHRYTAAQRMHIVATYWTPELPRSWVFYQFERMGGSFTAAKKVFEHQAYQEPGRSKYSFLGTNNLAFIGHEEIERYYLRRDRNAIMSHPSWAIPYFNDARKQGVKLQEIADRLELTMNQVKHMVYDVAPRGIFRPNVKNPNLGNPWKH